MWSQPRSQFNVLRESSLYGAEEVTRLLQSLNHCLSKRENKFRKASVRAYVYVQADIEKINRNWGHVMTQSSESSLSMLFYTLNHHSCSHLAYLIKIKLNHKPFFFLIKYIKEDGAQCEGWAQCCIADCWWNGKAITVEERLLLVYIFKAPAQSHTIPESLVTWHIRVVLCGHSSKRRFRCIILGKHVPLAWAIHNDFNNVRVLI